MAVSDDAGENAVSYSVKELFGRIEQRLGHIDDKLDSKASQAEMYALCQRVDKLESVRDRMIGGAIVLTITGGSIGSILTQIIGGG